MKTIGLTISTKENEKRRAITLDDLKNNKDICKYLYIQKGYGDVLGVSDSEYEELGCHVCDFDEVISQSVIVDPKIGDATYLNELKENQIIFGWIHATQNKEITDKILKAKVKAIAWEKMFYKGRHIFYKNNELAGEAAVIDAFLCYGKLPYETKCALIGAGNTARGALKALSMLGASVKQYTREMESLLREELGQFDVIVNCVLWDVKRKDHIISIKDLDKMKRDSIIIDVSCDRHGAIESSEPTTIANPIYFAHGIMHYAVDHTPALFYKSFTKETSSIIIPYLRKLINEQSDDVLYNATIINNGLIIDDEINKFQNR